MKNHKKLFAAIFFCILAVFVVPSVDAQAVSYVSSDSSATVNGHTVRIRGGKLQTRKGSNSWKTIVSNGNLAYTFTTNGSTIYYSIVKQGGAEFSYKSTIYAISVTGKNKRIIKTVSGAIATLYRYGNHLYYCVIPTNVPDGRNIYSLSLSAQTVKKIKANYYIISANGKYILMHKYAQETVPSTLYCRNLSNNKSYKISSNALYARLINGKIFYANSGSWNNGWKTQIKRCNPDGKSSQNLTSMFYCNNISAITDSYVKYYNWQGNIQKKGLQMIH